MKKNFLLFLITFLSSTFSFAQAPAKWSVSGNTTASGDFLGTTNNNPLIFYANNTEWMRLKTNGDLKINSLSGTGDNFIFSNSNGVLFTKPCSADTNKFMTEAGVFRTASSFTGWKFNGNNIHTITGSFVGIGINNPQYQLDVAGDARLYGTLYAQGLILATKLQADTVKSTSMISINNNLSFFSGAVNDIFTSSGDVRLQSRIGYNGNTILNAGNNGNVGIGIYSPQYKFDVNGDVRVSGKMYIYRIVPLLGDSEIHFGDSSITLLPSVNAIHGSTSGNYRGFGLGWSTYSHGLFSTSIGHNVETDALAENSVVIGSGPANFVHLTNTIKNSLMVGFNSTVPTFFVGPGTGAATIGKVGIGTTNPQGDFQVGDGANTKFCIRSDGRVEIGSTRLNTNSPYSLDPMTRMTVDGRIMCQDLVISLIDWQDEVFDSTYHLMPMDSVNTFIQLNGHLPGVLSENKIETEGMSVAQTAQEQQAKIEELMLYVLQLNERMKALEKENANLKANGGK